MHQVGDAPEVGPGNPWESYEAMAEAIEQVHMHSNFFGSPVYNSK